ncbi:siphovirus Gp157 family protein [Deltaproteobacteria bacterium TL4]
MQALQVLKTETITKKDELNKEEKKIWGMLSLSKRSEIFSTALGYLDEDTTHEEFDLIAESEQALKDKLMACAHVAQKYDQAAEIILSEVEALKSQVKALEERASVFSNRSQRRREAMLSVMIQHGFKKLETPLLTVGMRQKPGRVLETSATLEGFDVAKAFTLLVDGCKKMLQATGSSKNWNGHTFAALCVIEKALEACKIKCVEIPETVDPEAPCSIFDDQMPLDYLRIKVEWDKRKIGDELKAGKAIEGFTMSEPEFSITIK